MSKLLPCPECGAEAFSGEETTVAVEEEFVFAGKHAERTLPGKVCPNCGEEFAL